MFSDFYSSPKKSMLKWMGIAAVGVTAMSAASLSQAETVKAGYDLWQTASHTSFLGIPFVGIPLVSYDFLPSSSNFSSTDPRNPTYSGPDKITLGVNGVGSTDTIVQRTQDVTVTGTTDLKMLALNLVTDGKQNFGGFGLDLYYTALDILPPDPPTLSATSTQCGNSLNPNTMQIGAGTLNSCLDFVVDFYKGSPKDNANSLANLVAKAELVITSSGAWQHDIVDPTANGYVLKLANINYWLNGSNTAADFWPHGNISSTNPTGSLQENVAYYRLAGNPLCTNPNDCNWSSFEKADPDTSHHFVDPALPEPSTLSLFALGVGLFGLRRRKNVVKTI